MTDYALPITGTGSSQAVSAEAHDAEVQRAIDEAVAVEEARALLAEDAVASAIAAEAAARISAVAAEQSARIAADTAEQVARIAGDASLSDAINAEAAARISEDGALLSLATAGDAIRLVGGSGTAQAATYTVRAEQADLIPGIGSLIVFEWPADNTAADPVLSVGALSLTLRTPGGGAMDAGDLRASVTHIARVHGATTARVLTLTRIGGVNGLQSALDGKAAAVHTHAASEISDSTAPGRAILTAATVAAQRTALGLGTAATTAASDYATAAQGGLADSAVQPGDPVSDLVETGTAKIMTAAERTKLAGIATGATANATDAQLRDRATHTGTQAIATVTGLQSALDAQTAALTTKADALAVDDAATGARVPLIAAGDDVVLYLDPAGALDGRPLGDPMRRSVLDGVVDQIDATGPVPVALVDGQAAVWLDAMGNLGAPGMAATLRRAAMSDIVTDLPPEGDRVPLLLAGDRVLMWIGQDGLNGPGMIKGISEVAARAEFAPRASAGDLPASTDGRSLARARRKAAQVRAGASETLRVAMIGDSWTQGLAIPNAMRDLLAEVFGDCGESWVHAGVGGHWSGAGVAGSAGWNWLDADITSGWPYGAAPDGRMGWTSATTDTLTIVTPSCTEARIYTRRHGGTWRWRVDGGSWTTVTEATGGALTITTISGLAAATHTIEIDTIGNTGVVAWCGMDTRTSGASAEVVKLGNSGLSAIDMQSYIAGAQDILADLAPDVVICILGTNDYISADSTVAVFGAALDTLTATARAAAPGVGLVFVAPALSSSSPVTPLSEYRDEAYARALALGAEYLGAYDLIAPYADDPALWTDSRHLNQLGGDVLCRLINNRLMGI